jgi:hypothetical protein
VKYQTGSEPSFNKNVLGTDFRAIGWRSLYFFLAAMQWLMRIARPIHGLSDVETECPFGGAAYI